MMNTKVIEDLFYLCRLHMYHDNKTYEDNYLLSDTELLKKIIIENGLTSFLYKQIKSYDSKYHCYGENSLKSLEEIVRYDIVGELNKYQAIRKIVSEANKRSVSLVFFKGLIIANLYPQYTERISSDSDILVKDYDREAAEQLLRDCGYMKIEEESKKHVQVYKNQELSHVVELHTRLWEDYHGPKIDILKRLNLTEDSSCIHMRACGIDVVTLGIEQHLVYQLFHIIKHFSLDGIGIRYLIDITLYVNRYFEDIDFDLFWKHMELLGYTKFVEAFFRICIEELSMNDKVFDNHLIQFEGNDYELKVDLLNVGNINSKEAGWQIMGAMEAYFTGDAIAPESGIKRKLSMIFPSVKALPRVYRYAIRYPILLPIAWIHRWGKFLIKKHFHKDEFYGVREKIDIAEHRMQLIKDLGLTIER